MSVTITVIGGVNAGNITGIVSVPVVLPASNILNTLQSFLTNTLQPSVTGGTANFENLVVAGLSGSQTVTVASGANSVGDLTFSNTEANGSVVGGVTSISAVVPTGYSVLYVQAPGKETITGNGSDNFLGVFSSLSAVTFNTGGGSGTIAAGGPGDNVVLVGSNWSLAGSTLGSETVSAVANNSTVNVYGTGTGTTPGSISNVVALDADNVAVNSNGTNDLIEGYGGTATISVNGGANVLINGGNDTVFAEANSSSVNGFFENNGGQLYFVNNSNNAATVSGAISGAVGGNVTAFGGAGGGVYEGGPGGNNSLIGGTGLVTLYGAGASSTLVGASSLAGGNDLFAGVESNSGGSVYMLATSTSGSNQFTAYTGSTTAVSFGTGSQNFFVGTAGQDVLTGSTVTGAVNNYYFNQDSSGSGSDVITNFRVGTDNLFVNAFGADTGSGVEISSMTTVGGAGGGILVSLSDNTTIRLYGVSLAAADSATAAGGLKYL
jgi:hypothetical protein